MSGTLALSQRAQAILDRLIVGGVAAIVLVLLWYLVVFVREMLSPNEPYAESVGLSLDQCAASVRGGLTGEEADAYCRRPVPKRF